MYSQLWILLVGYALLSLGLLFYFLPAIPEIIQSVSIQTGVAIDDPLLNDKTSGIYHCIYNLGAIVAPPIGGALNDSIGFRKTNDLMALLSFTFFIIYLTFNYFLCQKPIKLPKDRFHSFESRKSLKKVPQGQELILKYDMRGSASVNCTTQSELLLNEDQRGESSQSFQIKNTILQTTLEQ